MEYIQTLPLEVNRFLSIPNTLERAKTREIG
jgi:hypothetical protein